MQKTICKSTFTIANLAILSLSTITCGNPDSAKVPPPNILFIAVDDLRPELNCYGQHHIHSPNIDRLASLGTIFKRNYCQVPVCGASRASLLCGVRPTSRRFVDYTTRMDEDFPGAISLPEHFKQNGYTTVSLGKIFHYADDQLSAWSKVPWSPTTTDAEYGWFDYADSNSLAIIRNHPEFKPGGDRSKMRGPAFEYPDVPDTAYKDGKLAEKAIQELNAFAKEGRPFFWQWAFGNHTYPLMPLRNIGTCMILSRFPCRLMHLYLKMLPLKPSIIPVN
ncbi:MAG: sulfatase-like hydrolase/transferase [Saprospiraceae bacterium]|nr:sulfatase-like hydrolase/transferase [Saprospiraceae bacterium]